MVEEVGARSNGQASSSALITKLIFPDFAMVDWLLLVRVKILEVERFKAGKISIISFVSPELDKIKIESFLLIIPKSP